MIRALGILFAGLTLAACAAPAIQPPLTPPPDFAGPALEARTLLMDDGARLPLARWAPDRGEPWAVIVALHGMNDSRESLNSSLGNVAPQSSVNCASMLLSQASRVATGLCPAMRSS